MSTDDLETATERTSLLGPVAANGHHLSLPQRQREHDTEAQSIVTSVVTKEEQQMADSTVGERLPYNDYSTIDWLHDLVKDSYRFRALQSRKGLRYTLIALFEASSGWIAVVLIGTLTACVASIVDVSASTVSDWKLGHCTRNPLLSRESCCRDGPESVDTTCEQFELWTDGYTTSFAIYVGMAVVFGIVSSGVTMLTKTTLPVAETEDEDGERRGKAKGVTKGKVMYMAAGSGIPEIKTILSGFTIPHFLTFRVLSIKALGATFAVASGLCLGKEGPFVHISTCIGHLVSTLFPTYRSNGRKHRELLSAACASGLAVAFGAPIGGVLFSYEEISTYFPRKVLWRAFLCCAVAAMVLRGLNPMGTGKLVLFETSYGTQYEPMHYLVFVFLGIAGGVWGGLFCKLNYKWSRWFRSYEIIKQHPVFEVFLVVLVTALLQFPNTLTRDPGDVIIKNLLVDCSTDAASTSWVCRNEEDTSTTNWRYIGLLIHGTLTKLILTIITFGCKVPSGVIIPALDAGALFGRLIGQCVPSSNAPGLFAMVGAAAFLAGVSRMTLSLAVIMFELTGELSYIVPHMIAILVAKWVADWISEEGVYDLAQTVLGHPFLDADGAVKIVRQRALDVEILVPPRQTMEDITVEVGVGNKVPYSVLKGKLDRLKSRGLMDAGLVLVQCHAPSSVPMLQGYISQSELDFGLSELCPRQEPGQPDVAVRLLGHSVDGDDNSAHDTLEVDLTPFVDRTPLTLCAKAPLEYAVEMFSKLGLRYLCVTEEGTGRLVGVVIKKRLVGYLEGLKEDLKRQH